MNRIAARKVWIAVFVLAGSGFLAAAEPLTLAEALDAALQNNADLKKNAVSLQQAKRDKDNAWNMFLPSLSAGVGIRNTHPITPPEKETEPQWPWSASASASLNFTAAIPARIKLLSLKYQAAEESYQNEIRKLTASVSTSFYSLLADKLSIEILRSDLEVKRQQYESVNLNYGKGLASELDLLNAQYTFQTAGPALNDAIVKYEQNIAAFLLLIGMDAKTE